MFKMKSGIKITRRLPSNERTRSYVGGAPMLPESVQWPTLPDKDVAIPFLAQIDLGELPTLMSSPLPSHGFLFFFFDFFGESPAHRVIHAADCGPTETAIPKNLVPLGEYGNWAPAPFEWAEFYYANGSFPPEQRMHARPRYALRFEPVMTFNPPLGRKGRPWEDEKAFYESLGLPLPRGPNVEDWYSSSTDWPWAWVIVELIVRRKFRERERHFVINKMTPALRERHYEEARRWLDRALESGRFTPMATAESYDFRRWLFSLYLSAWRSQGCSDEHIVSIATDRRPTFLLVEVARITTACISLLLDARHGNPGLLPESVAERFIQYSTAETQHQILGFGNDGQNPPQNHYENVLLLQLVSDYDSMMLWGDCGALQFCISEADLQSRAFDRAYCWMSD